MGAVLVARGGGAPTLGRRRGESEEAQRFHVNPKAASAWPGGRRRRRIGRRPARGGHRWRRAVFLAGGGAARRGRRGAWEARGGAALQACSFLCLAWKPRRAGAGLRRSHVRGGLRLGPDGLRGRARVWAGAGLGRAWWAAACEATAAGEGNEGARADFGSWAAEKRRWAAGRGCWVASCPRIEGAAEDFRD
jgi:hypothetical protein